MSNLILLADGGSRGNPGPAASGFVILLAPEIAVVQKSNVLNPEVLDIKYLSHQQGFDLGVATNNVAEWTALERGLEYLLSQNLQQETLQVLMDSNLVIQQIQGLWKVKDVNLHIIWERTRLLLTEFQFIKFAHIYREFNSLPDLAVNQVLDNL